MPAKCPHCDFPIYEIPRSAPYGVCANCAGVVRTVLEPVDEEDLDDDVREEIEDVRDRIRSSVTKWSFPGW